MCLFAHCAMSDLIDFFQIKKIGELALCNRHINCDHQGPMTVDFIGDFEISFISVQSTN